MFLLTVWRRRPRGCIPLKQVVLQIVLFHLIPACIAFPCLSVYKKKNVLLDAMLNIMTTNRYYMYVDKNITIFAYIFGLILEKSLGNQDI